MEKEGWWGFGGVVEWTINKDMLEESRHSANGLRKGAWENRNKNLQSAKEESRKKIYVLHAGIFVCL